MVTLPTNPPAAREERHVWRVAEIARCLREVVEQEFGHVWVEGEISTLRRPASGHLYFILKDEQAQLRAVLFRGQRKGLQVEPADGMRVRVYAQLTVYERGGDVQLAVRLLEEAGKGSLQQAFEALKKRLADEGLFDAARKRPLPLLPLGIGVVTSPTGAALRDILQVLDRRFPNLRVLLAPTRVQGEGAAAEIAAGVERLNRFGGIEVILVARGGGSTEDLWCFNEEIVARAIASSRLPVISAVGHEIDFTIADFAADLRAPTPSAAAELVVGRKEDFVERLASFRARLARALEARRLRLRQRLTAAGGSYVFREPGHLVRRSRERLQRLSGTMLRCIQEAPRRRQQRVDELSLKAGHLMALRRREWSGRLARLNAQLRALGPLAVLARGYSLTRREDGLVLRDPAEAPPGARLRTTLAGGTITSTVTGGSREREG